MSTIYNQIITKNVLIFGSCGAGKSSLVNTIAGQTIAETSASTRGKTLTFECFKVVFKNVVLNIWDTAGLNEPENGSVPHKDAIRQILALLDSLSRSNGVHLLIHVVRWENRTNEMFKSNLELFSHIICQSKVPCVVAYTHLERDLFDTLNYKKALKADDLKEVINGNNIFVLSNLVCVTNCSTYQHRSKLKKSGLNYNSSRYIIYQTINKLSLPEGWNCPSSYESKFEIVIKYKLFVTRQYFSEGMQSILSKSKKFIRQQAENNNFTREAFSNYFKDVFSSNSFMTKIDPAIEANNATELIYQSNIELNFNKPVEYDMKFHDFITILYNTCKKDLELKSENKEGLTISQLDDFLNFQLSLKILGYEEYLQQTKHLNMMI